MNLLQIKIRRVLISLAVSLFLFTNLQAQLVVNHSFTPAQLVSQILLGNGVTVSNITYTGDTGAIGYFDGTASNIGLPAGVMLCTGDIYNAVGPVGTQIGGTCWSLPGDADLTNLCGCGITNDAAIIEFDFVPTADTVKFNYVFGSEEYPEFVGSFNDIFAFFISGPGIVGTPNIATLPFSVTPVSISTVNNGNGFCPGNPPVGPCMNCQYYVDNCNGTTVNYGGFTVPLTAMHTVIPCQTYHIKIAIADALDCVYDSGVFLQQGSFTGGSGLTVSTHTTNQSDTFAVAGCVNGIFTFTLPAPLLVNDTVRFTIGGTAVNGTDYNHIADSVIIVAGQTVDSIIVNSLLINGLGNKYITLIIPNNNGCNNGFDTVTLWLYNINPLVLNVSHDTTVCPNQNVTLNATSTGGYGTYSYLWNNNAGTDSTITVAPLITTTYSVTVTDACGHTATQSITITVASPETISTTRDTLTQGCNTATVTFTLNTIQNSATTITYNIGGTAVNGIDYSPIPANIIIPAGQTTGTITINPLSGSLVNKTIVITLTNTCVPDSVTITIIPDPPINVSLTGNTNICPGQNTTLTVTASGGLPPLTYFWSDNLGTSTSVVVSPSNTQIYSIVVTDSCHSQSRTDTITVFVDPMPKAYFTFNQLNGELLINFINESVNADSYLWEFGDGSSSTTSSLSFEHHYTDTSGIYHVTLIAYNAGGCADSVTATVEFKQQYSIFVPNSFTPNTSMNQTFGAYGVGIQQFQMSIFDRWGEMLFYTEDLSNQWDGTKNGVQVSQGLYVWTLTAILQTGEKVTRQGTVTLIK
jgi:gliding motility-associated-like protein